MLTLSKNSNVAKLEDLLEALLKNGLKISTKKCQLFRTNLHYMGNEILTKDKRVCVKALRSRLETIQKPHHSKKVQKLCENGEFSDYVLPRTIEIIETHI